MDGELGTAVVAPRLTVNVLLQLTDLEPFDDAVNPITAGLIVTREGFGKIQVGSATAALGAAGTYRGLVDYKEPTMGSFEPLAWAVVVITP